MPSISVARRSASSAFLLLPLILLLLALQAPAAQAGTIVADSGFRPEVDGFSFRNYGDGTPHVNLDKDEMQRIFGQAACLAGKGGKCVLTPGARSWMEQMNEASNGGHCYGFAALSQYIHKGQLPRFGYSSIAAFGPGDNPFDLTFDGNVRLQRSIARAFVAQYFPSVVAGAKKGTPKEIIEFLIGNLGSAGQQSWNLAIFQWGFKGGHSITPYAVEDMGDGRYDIHVYDNNMPGDSSRRVHVDTVKNTWNYYATTRPDIAEGWYRGNAKSKTLSLDPNLQALGVQACPVCGGRQGAKSKYNQITLSGGADQPARLLITDGGGRQTGYRNGKLINRIPGAKVVQQKTGVAVAADGTMENTEDSPSPIYLIPKKLKVSIRIDGHGMEVRDRESLGVVGPTFDATIENLKMGPGRVAFATLSPRKQTLSMTGAKGESSPRVTFGAESRNQAYRIKASAIGAPSRSTFYFAKKSRYGLLRIGRKQAGRQGWRVVIERWDRNGASKYGIRYRLAKRQVAFLYYAPLAVGKRAYVVIASQNGNRVKLRKLRKLD